LNYLSQLISNFIAISFFNVNYLSNFDLLDFQSFLMYLAWILNVPVCQSPPPYSMRAKVSMTSHSRLVATSGNMHNFTCVGSKATATISPVFSYSYYLFHLQSSLPLSEPACIQGTMPLPQQTALLLYGTALNL
jgi:hypothetical protein